MKIYKLILGLLMLTVILQSVIGCSAKNSNALELQMYNYPDALFPTPDKAVLFRSLSDKPEEIELSKIDINILQKIMRTAIDRPLALQKANNDPWTANRKFALELTYEKPPGFELVLEKNKSVTLETTKVLVNLEQKTLLLQVKDGVQVLSGLVLSDEFVAFMKQFTKNQGFPLPPGKHTDITVEQLPLAKPEDAKVELLPPSQPRTKPGN